MHSIFILYAFILSLIQNSLFNRCSLHAQKWGCSGENDTLREIRHCPDYGGEGSNCSSKNNTFRKGVLSLVFYSLIDITG